MKLERPYLTFAGGKRWNSQLGNNNYAIRTELRVILPLSCMVLGLEHILGTEATLKQLC
jgi:hypothetical protein